MAGAGWRWWRRRRCRRHAGRHRWWSVPQPRWGREVCRACLVFFWKDALTDCFRMPWNLLFCQMFINSSECVGRWYDICKFMYVYVSVCSVYILFIAFQFRTPAYSSSALSRQGWLWRLNICSEFAPSLLGSSNFRSLAEKIKHGNRKCTM